ncbi:pentatricopeptide repeat-containing protein At4g13650 [Mercurialis annua]|uniref:pentatricopeptide repeat-containing protein At4g13650 n=1 Tax=Mercurialis annua TaxID=3986 RepID=UPI00216048FA|nr:pentatricopeptide repeat-containing protein At4g13650 [Mercurialis annua]
MSLRSSISRSFLFNFPRNFKVSFTLKRTQNTQRCFNRNLSGQRVACNALDEISDLKNEDNLRGIDSLHLMDERRIRANSQTYLSILDSCSNSESFLDCKKTHAKILKTGFHSETVLGDKLIDFYLAVDDLVSVDKVFDEMSSRNVIIWNKVFSAFVAKKMSYLVFSLFFRMVKGNVNPSVVTFASVLKACGSGHVGFRYVEHVHASIIYHGFETSPVACNPLVDLYAKNGLTHSARKIFDDLSVKDNVSLVAMISGYSQNGYGIEAVRLFYEVHMSGIHATPYVFSSVLSACKKVELFDIAEQLHALVFKFGFFLETYVCNALVTMYSRSGDFVSAEQVFRKIQCKDGVSYNSLISGLAQQGYSDRALELFKKMQLDLLKPDCVTVASLLSACASNKSLSKGEQLHSYVVKAGMSPDIIIEGSLLDLYVKCSDINTAHRFFHTTKTENVVLWNVMLVAYGQLDDLSKSFQIFRQMQIEGLLPNEFTYPSILRTCTCFQALDLGEQIHSQVIKTGFQFNLYVCSVLIDMYAKLGKLDIARGILRRLSEEDVVSWTAMIAGYTQHDLFNEALKLYEEMLSRRIQSDNIGFSSAISACAGIRALNQGRQIHAQSYLSGYSEDLSIGNALVSLYARCGRIEEAYLAFEKIDAKDSISWNALISGFAQSGYYEEALKIFGQVTRGSVEASFFTFGSAVSAAANMANIKQGKQIHTMIIKTGFHSEVEVSNALITLYAKCGCIDDARTAFSETPGKNDISWNAMITGYSQHGYGIEAVSLFERMKQVGVKPNHVTFVGVISACSHVGLVNEGLDYFESMSKEHGLVPKPEHYACVVDLLCRAGRLSQARAFIDKMPIEPDAMIWRTLLSACAIHKNTEVGEIAARHLLEVEPEDSASYVLLSNMYAIAGKWDCRDQTRQMMKDRGVKKEPGRSWIEVKNSVHAFFVGDRLHPLAEKIYEFLADLNKRAEEIGYVQDRYSLLNDEQEQKDPTVYIHSEKLAISFGLLSLTNPIPIRVIKNLRVCNDCHTWIKFISKISNRIIVVRDAYRFHHFEGGNCSCKDYW